MDIEADLEKGSRQTRRDSRLNRGMAESPGEKLARGQVSIRDREERI
jgi:hypothetical protein